MKLAEKMNADRSFVDKIVREVAAVRTYTRIRRPEFRPELEQRQRGIVERTRTETTILRPTGEELDPLAVP